MTRPVLLLLVVMVMALAVRQIREAAARKGWTVAEKRVDFGDGISAAEFGKRPASCV